jgi:ubiquinone/menaquinone biosynthesis C-methylase UbiE
MLKERIPETKIGIQGEINVQIYDTMQRRLKDKGWLATDQIIETGINSGIVLEVGPGPGYLGLEWLKKTTGTRLNAIEISNDMIDIARKNASEYKLEERVIYIEGDAQSLPFQDNFFDAIFSNGSLHEWSNPEKILSEMYRVLRKEGRIFISDFKRNLSFIIRCFFYLAAKPKAIRPGLFTSLNAAYTKEEIDLIIKKTSFKNYEIKTNPMGLVITGKK